MYKIRINNTFLDGKSITRLRGKYVFKSSAKKQCFKVVDIVYNSYTKRLFDVVEPIHNIGITPCIVRMYTGNDTWELIDLSDRCKTIATIEITT